MNVKDHTHTLEHRETKESPDLGGRTVIRDCVDAECEYWRASWEDRTTLSDFGGETA